MAACSGMRCEALSEKYGKADFISAPVPFAYTDYYAKEFGGSLIRRFVAFDRLIRPDSLPDIKLWTNCSGVAGFRRKGGGR